MRTIGLDVGSKTIGVAITDELGLLAHPQTTLSRQGTAKDVKQVMDLCAQYGVSCAVVGLPYDCDGNEGHRASRVRVFGEALSLAGLSVVYQDESYSTVEAEQVLLSADLSRKRRKQVIDRLAAAVILQAWLDANRSRPAKEECP